MPIFLIIIKNWFGGDFKEFCDEAIANLPPKTPKEKLINTLDVFCLCMAVLGTINVLTSKDFLRVVDEMVSRQAVNYNIGIYAGLGMVISTIAIMIATVLIVNTILKSSFKKENDQRQFCRCHNLNIMFNYLEIRKSSFVFCKYFLCNTIADRIFCRSQITQ